MSNRGWIRSIERTEKKRKERAELEDAIRQRAADFALLFACRAGDYQVVRYCLTELRSNPDTNASMFRPALASAIGYVRVGNKADVGTRLKCAKLMLDHGANLNFRDGDGDTPLACAIRKGCVPITEELLRRKAVITGITGDQRHIMQVACEDPTNVDMLEYLKEKFSALSFDYWASLPGPGLDGA